MQNECNHDCSSCSASCGSAGTESFMLRPHRSSNIKKVVGVVSGKGGVGKSLVTSLLAVLTKRAGMKVGILDADITGPSIPMAFGIKDKSYAVEDGIMPLRSRTGIDIMSLNLLLEHDTDPVVWRGPIISGTVRQFWTDVIWGDIDMMFIDMPPGTGDIALTVFQSLPLDGVIVVTSPQEMVGMIVEKSVKMANLMRIPVLALIENMSYVICPCCDKKINLFGESRVGALAAKYGINLSASLPVDPDFAEACDSGDIEDFTGSWLDEVAGKLLRL